MMHEPKKSDPPERRSRRTKPSCHRRWDAYVKKHPWPASQGQLHAINQSLDAFTLSQSTLQRRSIYSRSMKTVSLGTEHIIDRSAAERPHNGRSEMKTLRNGLRVLRLLSELDKPIGVTDLSRRLDLDKATAHRLLTALVDEGFVEKDPDLRRYTLGMGIVDIAVARLRDTSVTACALSHMEALRDRLNETIALMVPDGRNMACALVSESKQTVRIALNIGERIPVYRTASGFAWVSAQPSTQWTKLISASIGREILPPGLTLKTILGEVQKTQNNGYAVSKFYRPEAAGVAAPIIDDNGRCVAVLTLGALSENLRPPQDTKIGRLLIGAADRISTDLRGRRQPAVKRII